MQTEPDAVGTSDGEAVVPPDGPAARWSARLDDPGLRRTLDITGVVLLLAVVLVLGSAISQVGGSDLIVYFSALRHLGSDDVYEHLYPIWPYTYPPSSLLIMGLLRSPLAVARVLMYALSVASVVTTINLTVRSAAGPRSRWARVGPVALLSAACLASVPIVLGVALGQVAPVVMGLTAIATLARRSRWSGAWLGTAVAVKLTPVVFAAYWWMIGRRRAAFAAGATMLAWTVLGAVVLPASSRWYFLEGGMGVTDEVYAQGSSNASNQALNGFVARLGIELPGGRLFVLAVSAAAILLALGVAARVHRAGWEAAAVALVGIWSGVAAPVAFVHAFGWWVPLGVAIGLSGRRRWDVVAGAITCAAPYLIVVGPSWDVRGIGVVQDLYLSGYGVLAILLTGWLWWRTRPVSA